jgi:phage terminase large subunit
MNYERYKGTNPSHYWNMVRGLVPEVVRGKIYSGWRLIDSVPHGARFECFALDFGYHPDPAAVVAIYYLNGEYIIDQVAYANEMLNRHIANVIKNYGKGLVVADHAEPKSIDELIEFGLDVVPCEKGADSVDYGIKKVQGLKISVTRRSTKVWKEYENYAWKVDKDGNDMGVVDPNCDDHAMDAVRYGLSFLKPADPLEERIQQVERVARNRDRENETRQNAGL